MPSVYKGKKIEYVVFETYKFSCDAMIPPPNCEIWIHRVSRQRFECLPDSPYNQENLDPCRDLRLSNIRCVELGAGVHLCCVSEERVAGSCRCRDKVVVT